MYIDMDGVKRLKINLHAHTTDSDGRVSTEEAARIYREAGYDVLAIADHWRWHKSGELSGLRILAGAEYNVGGSDGAAGVYHILGLARMSLKLTGKSRIPSGYWMQFTLQTAWPCWLILPGRSIPYRRPLRCMGWRPPKSTIPCRTRMNPAVPIRAILWILPPGRD